jgi:hypothetical protein
MTREQGRKESQGVDEKTSCVVLVSKGEKNSVRRLRQRSCARSRRNKNERLEDRVLDGRESRIDIIEKVFVHTW